jgi:DNA-binding transcriptional ArsR family regulator
MTTGEAGREDTWLTQPRAEDVDVAAVLHALADPARLEIAHILDERGEASCTSLGLPLSPSTVTHHLRTLRDAGVIATRAHGTARISRLRRDDLERRFPGLLPAILGASRPAGGRDAEPADRQGP